MEISYPKLLILGLIFIVLLVVFGGPEDEETKDKRVEEEFIENGGDPLVKAIEDSQKEGDLFDRKPAAINPPVEPGLPEDSDPDLSNYMPNNNPANQRTMPPYMYNSPPAAQPNPYPAVPQASGSGQPPPPQNSYYPPPPLPAGR